MKDAEQLLKSEKAGLEKTIRSTAAEKEKSILQLQVRHSCAASSCVRLNSVQIDSDGWSEEETR